MDDLSFNVQAGEVLGFLGPNGAGKSTTTRMLVGYLRPDAGSIKIFGEDIERSPLQVKQMLGYLPEGAPSYGDMSVLSFLAFIAEVRGVPKVKCRASVGRVLERLQLESVRRQTDRDTA